MFAVKVIMKKTIGLSSSEDHMIVGVMSHFHIIPARDRQTDRHSDLTRS